MNCNTPPKCSEPCGDCTQEWPRPDGAQSPAEAHEPLFWYRPCGDGLYEGPVYHKSVGGKMLRDEKPGEWVPLFPGAHPQPKGTQEPYGFESGLVQLLNEARCLSNETVGNRELAGRVMKYIRMYWDTPTQAPAPAQQPEAAPAPEPVAWGLRRDDGLILDVICPDEHARVAGDYTVPLYAAPVQCAAVQDGKRDDKRMFEQAVRSLAAIDDALGIGDDGCGDLDSTLTAIAELKRQASALPDKTPFDTCPTCEALALAVMSDQTSSDASVADALDAKRYRFIKSYDNPDSPLAICSWRDVGWGGEWAIEHNPDDVIDAEIAAQPPVQHKEGA